MKNKKITYGLIIVVVAVWGIVLYKIIGGVSGDDPVLKSNNAELAPLEIPSGEPDTFSLLANYKDPFLKNVKKKRVHYIKPQKQKKKKEETPEPKGKVDWSFIAYRGIFKNNMVNKKTALITVMDHDYVVAEGDSVGHVQIKRLFKDSIGVFYKGRFNYIKKF